MQPTMAVFDNGGPYCRHVSVHVRHHHRGWVYLLVAAILSIRLGTTCLFFHGVFPFREVLYATNKGHF